MTGHCRRAVAGVGLYLVLLATAAAAPVSSPRAGRPVAEVLVELQSPGLEFLFSTELVPPTLVVLAEPNGSNALEIARQILAPHGLELSPVRRGLYSVVSAPSIGADGRMRDAALETPDPPMAPVALAEVLVSTSRYTLERTGGFGAMRIEGDAIETQPVLGEDALRSLGRVPGATQNGLSAQSNIRGGEENEVLTLLDGFPLRQAFHLPGYQSPFGVIDPGLIAGTDIYTGGFPVRYGNRMAGVFDLTTIDASATPATALGVSNFNAMARSAGELQRFDSEWLTAARIGTLKPFINWFAHGAGSPTYGDVYARASHGDQELLRLTANVLWSRDELSITREGRDEEARIESRARYLWLRADRDFGASLHASLWLGHSRMDSFRSGEMTDPDIAIGSVRDRRASAFKEIRGRMDWRAGDHHWFESGVEFVQEDSNYRYSANARYSPAVADLFVRDESLRRSVELHPRRDRFALYAGHRWQPFDQWISEIGLRAARTGGTASEPWSYDPRVNVSWRLAPHTSLRAHWGRFHQTDEVHELKVEDGILSFPPAQRSDQLIVGFDHRLSGSQSLRVEWFRKLQSDPRPHFENLFDPLSVIPEIAPDRVVVAPVASDIHGAEISLASDNSAIAWWIALAWSESLDSLGGRRVARSWDQTWSASGGIDWQRGPWRYGAYGAVRRGWPTTRLRDDVLGERNAARFPMRAALDLRAEYRRTVAVGSLSVTAELSNVINVGNRCCQELIAENDGQGGVTFRTKTTDWLPLVPSLGVIWEF